MSKKMLNLIGTLEQLNVAAIRRELLESGKRAIVLRHLLRAAESAQRLRQLDRQQARTMVP